MPFSEGLKLTVKRKAHFCCALCHTLGVEIHHIVPQAENGSDSDDNAVPLCPSCHETYGANPEKRKFIRQARDLWYELCDKRYASDKGLIEKVLEIVQGSASTSDIGRVLDKITEFQQTIHGSLSGVVARERYLSQIDQLQQRLLGVENEVQSKALTLSQIRQREAILIFGVKIATEIIESQASDNELKVMQNYFSALSALKKLGDITPERFAQILQNASKERPIPDHDLVSQVLYHVTLIFGCFEQVMGSIKASTAVVPTFLDENDKNPGQSRRELLEALGSRLKAKADALEKEDAAEEGQ